MAIIVDEILFPLVGKRLSGATLSHTSYQRGLNGEQVLNADWQDNLRRFDITPGIKTLQDQAVVETFFIVQKGPVVGFLMRDWKDHTATHTATVLQGAIEQRGVVSAISSTVFQLEKSYTTGVRTHRRRITRPQAGTVLLYDSALNLIGGGYTLETVGGRATFSAPPGAQAPAYWSGQFYVPVHFADDEIPWDIIQYHLLTKTGHGDMPEVVLEEVRE